MTSYSEATMDMDSFEPGRSADESPVKGTPRLSASDKLRLSPSMLARKILCPAFIPSPIAEGDRLRFLGLHSMATLRTIARHIRSGYVLRAIERAGPGYRVDLLFQSPEGTTRIAEVKSGKRIREVHKL